MAQENQTGVPEVDSSLATLFDKSTLYTAFFPAGACVDTVKEAGYRGIEWIPFRTVAGIQMNAGAVNQGTKDAVVSLHQSFRSEKSIGQAWHHPNKAFAIISYVALPERVSSLNNLERLQKVIGRGLPVVLYPENAGEEPGTERNFQEKTFQPTPEVMQKWKVKTVDELITESKRRGYTGFCVDLAHMRGASRGEYTLNPWQETLPQLLTFAQKIHIAAGRVDMAYENTEAELKDLIKGTRYTELPQMLEVVKKSGYRGRIVTEIPAIALHRMHGGGQFLPINTLIQDHKEIVHNVKAWLS